jgi:hypothetical protein
MIKEVFTLNKLSRINLALGVWLLIAPFVLQLIDPRVFQLGWQDFLLGFGIAICALCRIVTDSGANTWDLLIMALAVTTLLNPILFHYFNVKVIAWNNLIVGSLVLILAIFADRNVSEASGKKG